MLNSNKIICQQHDSSLAITTRPAQQACRTVMGTFGGLRLYYKRMLQCAVDDLHAAEGYGSETEMAM